MIHVTRLNGAQIDLNPDLIVSLESSPDTILTLTNGDKLLLKESREEVVSRFIAYKQRIHTQTP